MIDSHALSNVEIADIYQNMLAGDKNGLYRLQRINTRNQIPKIMEEYSRNKEKVVT